MTHKSGQRPDAPSAFPLPEERHGNGMTLRDWFAGQAVAECLKITWDDNATVLGNAQAAAIWAYGMADAMMRERDKK